MMNSRSLLRLHWRAACTISAVGHLRHRASHRHRSGLRKSIAAPRQRQGRRTLDAGRFAHSRAARQRKHYYAGRLGTRHRRWMTAANLFPAYGVADKLGAALVVSCAAGDLSPLLHLLHSAAGGWRYRANLN